jgi:heptaprenyl diphosphate synthase
MTSTVSTEFPYLRGDLERVQAAMWKAVEDSDLPVHESCVHFLRRPGRMFRPTLTLTSAHLFAPDGPATEAVVQAAAVVEILHLATLHHDDLSDRSQTRRGQPTVNAIHGEDIALISGDYLLASCIQLVATLGQEPVDLVSRTLRQLCDGQLREILDLHRADRTERSYFEAIAGKTAKLMSTAAAIGAMQAGASPAQQQAMGAYGHKLGVAFQVWDDVLDLWPVRDTGKIRFSDLANGVYTLPVILAIEAAGDALTELLDGFDGDPDRGRKVLAILEQHHTRERALAVVGDHIVGAVDKLRELEPEVPGAAARLVGVARELMPEVEQLLAAVAETEPPRGHDSAGLTLAGEGSGR